MCAVEQSIEARLSAIVDSAEEYDETVMHNDTAKQLAQAWLAVLELEPSCESFVDAGIHYKPAALGTCYENGQVTLATTGTADQACLPCRIHRTIADALDGGDV